jgi:chromosome partitioning protein
MRIVAVANQKGGVGKTTTSVNLAASLAARGQRVLLVDVDPQANATTGSGVDRHGLAASIYDVLLEGAPIRTVIQTLPAVRYDLLPAHKDLVGAEMRIQDLPGRESCLKQALAGVTADYDYCFIDCPPSLNLLTLTALVAAHAVLIPVQCEFYALEGIARLRETIEHLKRGANRGLEIEGVLRTMYDPRNNLSQQVSEELFKHFGALVYRTSIPRNVRLAEAPSYGQPVLYFDRSCSGNMAYVALAGEMVRRREGLPEAAA